MTPSAGELLVVSANFGGGVGSLLASGTEGADRVQELAATLADPLGDGAASGVPSVGLVQEMTRFEDREVDYARDLERALGPDAEHYYLPCNTTHRYPWEEKWLRRWSEEGISDMQEGVAAVAHRSATMAAASLRSASVGAGGPFRGLALDLPIVEFAGADERGPGWIDVPADAGGGSGAAARFRPAYYRGNRDTDPRAASAHRVALPSGAEVVVVNVHLATLRSENAGERKADPADEVARMERRPTPESVFVRSLHMTVIAGFVSWVYDELSLPVVVAGDFNALPDAGEMRQFMDASGLVPVLTREVCWRCREPVPEEEAEPKPLWTDASNRALLAEAAEDVRAAGGTPGRISATEHCACGAPLFTHKANFHLIDNVLHTDPAVAEERGLRHSVASGAAPYGIVSGTTFSDHMPVYAYLSVDSGQARVTSA